MPGLSKRCANEPGAGPVCVARAKSPFGASGQKNPGLGPGNDQHRCGACGLPEGYAATRDHADKKRSVRVAAGAEPHRAAACRITATDSSGQAADVREIISCADRTLMAPGARIEFRIDTVLPQPRPRPRPGSLGTLARLAARAGWERIAPGVDAADLREAFTHQAGEGFLEAPAGRYQVDYGAYAQMYIDGKRFGGRPGHPVQARHRDHHVPEQPYDPLGLLMLVQGTTGAQYVRVEPVRGTLCRMAAVRTGSAGLTVWIDDEHIRRIRFEEHASRGQASVSRIVTLELWDFGPPAESLNWSRLPSFRTPG